MKFTDLEKQKNVVDVELHLPYKDMFNEELPGYFSHFSAHWAIVCTAD